MTTLASPSGATLSSGRGLRRNSDRATYIWAAERHSMQTAGAVEVLDYARRRLIELTRLSRGWDGEHAGPISKRTVSFAVALLSQIVTFDGSATPQITPNPDGGVTIEWLVSQDTVGFYVSETRVSFWGEFADGKDAFPPFDTEDFEELGGTADQDYRYAIEDAANYLQKISANVKAKYRLSLQ